MTTRRSRVPHLSLSWWPGSSAPACKALLGAPSCRAKPRGLVFVDASAQAQIHRLGERLTEKWSVCFSEALSICRTLHGRRESGSPRLSQPAAPPAAAAARKDQAQEAPVAVVVVGILAPADLEDIGASGLAVPVIVLTPDELPKMAGVWPVAEIPAEAIQPLADLTGFEVFSAICWTSGPISPAPKARRSGPEESKDPSTWTGACARERRSGAGRLRRLARHGRKKIGGA